MFQFVPVDFPIEFMAIFIYIIELLYYIIYHIFEDVQVILTEQKCSCMSKLQYIYF